MARLERMIKDPFHCRRLSVLTVRNGSTRQSVNLLLGTPDSSIEKGVMAVKKSSPQSFLGRKEYSRRKEVCSTKALRNGKARH